MNSLRCGDVLLQRSYNIGSDYVIYAITPLYSFKFPEASANILNMAVREVLKIAIESNITTIAFPFSPENNDAVYPVVEFVHVLLRTLRRWLEIPAVASKIYGIYLIGGNDNIYPILRRYFPRNSAEEVSIYM